MSHNQIISAWKDPAYRARLSAEALSTLPPNPAGTVDLSDPALQPAAGAPTGFRVRSGVVAGWHYVSDKPVCSAYGDNLWLHDLTLD